MTSRGTRAPAARPVPCGVAKPPHVALVSLLFPLVVATLACAASESAPRVRIVAPEDEATIDTSAVLIELAADGVEIGPAGQPGYAHHHLFIDREITPPGETIPAGQPGIVHLGAGQSQYAIDGLTPGWHVVIAVLADADHVPLAPLVTDTVQFTVRP